MLLRGEENRTQRGRHAGMESPARKGFAGAENTLDELQRRAKVMIRTDTKRGIQSFTWHTLGSTT